MQHALAVGHGVARFIARDGDWGPIDLAPLSPARLASGERVVEANVI
jgi:hypothetical protein